MIHKIKKIQIFISAGIAAIFIMFSAMLIVNEKKRIDKEVDLIAADIEQAAYSVRGYYGVYLNAAEAPESVVEAVGWAGLEKGRGYYYDFGESFVTPDGRTVYYENPDAVAYIVFAELAGLRSYMGVYAEVRDGNGQIRAKSGDCLIINRDAGQIRNPESELEYIDCTRIINLEEGFDRAAVKAMRKQLKDGSSITDFTLKGVSDGIYIMPSCLSVQDGEKSYEYSGKGETDGIIDWLSVGNPAVGVHLACDEGLYETAREKNKSFSGLDKERHKKSGLMLTEVSGKYGFGDGMSLTYTYVYRPLPLAMENLRLQLIIALAVTAVFLIAVNKMLCEK